MNIFKRLVRNIGKPFRRGGVIRKAFNAIKKAIIPVLAIALSVYNPMFITSIGQFLGFSGTAATVAGTAAFQSSLALASGAKLEQAIKAGVVGAITAGAGIYVRGATGSAIAGSAAGSAAGTLARGGSPADIIRNAMAGGIGAGVAQYTSPSLGDAAKTFVATGDPRAALYAGISSQVENSITDAIRTGRVPVEDRSVMGEVPPEQPRDIIARAYAPPVTPTTQVGEGEDLPSRSFASAADIIGGAYRDPTTPKVPGEEFFYGQPRSDSVYATSNQQPTRDRQPLYTETSTAPRMATYGGGGAGAARISSVSPGVVTSPLQQALGAYTPPGEVDFSGTGGARRDVWNEASLKLKDALGV